MSRKRENLKKSQHKLDIELKLLKSFGNQMLAN